MTAYLTPNGRNAPAKQFLDSIGDAEKGTYNFRVENIRGLKWKPCTAASSGKRAFLADHEFKESPLAAGTGGGTDYLRIARTLSTAAEIIAEMRQQSRGAMASPATETEARLAEIWADLLKVQSISACDNFFDLGGHSLLAVLLLVRIQEAFGVELSIDDVYTGGLTLAGLAQRIDMSQLGNLDSPEYRELLHEIESLSDDEARRLLAESEPESGCGSS